MSGDDPDGRSEIDYDTARRLLSDQFPEIAPSDLKPVAAQGWDNRCFRVGDAHVARFPTRAGYVPQIARLERWTPWLSSRLEIELPTFFGRGHGGHGYLHDWAVLGWIEGNSVQPRSLLGKASFAAEVGAFLARLKSLPTSEGPEPGAENFHRGGSLKVYETETRQAIALLDVSFDVGRLGGIVDEALGSTPDRRQWVHGDLAPGNLIVRGSSLAGVIDWGLTAIGDPACDLAFGWTWLSNATREAFFTAAGAGRADIARARGWAVWKAAILRSKLAQGPVEQVARASKVLHELSKP